MNKDLLSGLFFLFFSICFAVASFGYDLGTWRMPGPGFFPFGAALLFGMISLNTIVKALKAAPSKGQPGAPADDFSPTPERIRGRILVRVMAGMLAYTLLLERLGFVLCTFLLILFFLRAVAGQRWRLSLVMAVSVAVGSQILFNVLLKAQIPNGILTLLWR